MSFGRWDRFPSPYTTSICIAPNATGIGTISVTNAGEYLALLQVFRVMRTPSSGLPWVIAYAFFFVIKDLTNAEVANT
eukprot:Em1113g1a